MTQVTTSVVVVTYHTGPALWLAIQSVLDQADCHELVIVDNGNFPDVVQRLQIIAQGDARMKLISGHGNIGFAKACNLGVKSTSGDYILLLNPDCILPPDALVNTVDALRGNPQAMLAGCLLVNPDGSEQRGGRRNLLTPENAIRESLGLKSATPLNLSETSATPASVQEVPAVSGAFMCISVNDYRAIGGMDEQYFLHMEDMDFCLRIQRRGRKIIFVPQVRVLHFRSTSRVGNSFVEWQKAKSFMRYINLHFKQQNNIAARMVICAGIAARCVIKIAAGFFNAFTQRNRAHEQNTRRVIALYHMVDAVPSSDALAGKRFLVSGASSQVGLCLIAKLLNAGAYVIALTNSTVLPFTCPRLSWLRYNLEEETQPMPQMEADYMIHAAPLWLLPKHIVKLSAIGIKRLVAFSSTSLSGKAASDDQYEKFVVQGLGNAERDIEALCKQHAVAYTMLRPTLIYGLGLDSNIARIGKVVRGFGMFPVYGNAQGKRQPVHAADLADAAIKALFSPLAEAKTYNVSGGETLSYADMVRHVFRVLGRKPKLVRIPFMPGLFKLAGALYQAKHINGEMARRMNKDLVFSHEAAVNDFNYAPGPFVLTSDMV